MQDRVVITGMGVISPIGTGKSAFWSGLRDGCDGIRTISLFPTSRSKCNKAAEVSHFKAEDYFFKKGLACLSRTAEMVCAASNLALADMRIDFSAVDLAEVGVVIGTTYGNINSMVQFGEGIYTEGPRFVNPMLFPNTVINSAAGYASILLGNTGLNVTISSGNSSAVAAIMYAVTVLRRNEAKIIFAGGGEELSQFVYLGFYHSGQLSGSQDHQEEDSTPFDRRRNGFFLGEGAAILALERLDHAIARKAPILAEIVGCDSRFSPDSVTSEERKVAIQVKAMTNALKTAQLSREDVSYISASANGSLLGDRIEAKAIKAVFEEDAKEIPISAIKSMIGESFGAAGALQIAGAVLSLQSDMVPPTVNFQEGDSDTALPGISAEQRHMKCHTVMVNCFDHTRNCSTLILKKFVD